MQTVELDLVLAVLFGAVGASSDAATNLTAHEDSVLECRDTGDIYKVPTCHMPFKCDFENDFCEMTYPGQNLDESSWKRVNSFKSPREGYPDIEAATGSFFLVKATTKRVTVRDRIAVPKMDQTEETANYSLQFIYYKDDIGNISLEYMPCWIQFCGTHTGSALQTMHLLNAPETNSSTLVYALDHVSITEGACPVQFDDHCYRRRFCRQEHLVHIGCATGASQNNDFTELTQQPTTHGYDKSETDYNSEDTNDGDDDDKNDTNNNSEDANEGDEAKKSKSNVSPDDDTDQSSANATDGDEAKKSKGDVSSHLAATVTGSVLGILLVTGVVVGIVAVVLKRRRPRRLPVEGVHEEDQELSSMGSATETEVDSDTE